MKGQMTVWDFLEYKALADMSEDEIVSEVSKRTGLNFKPDIKLSDGETWFQAKKGKTIYNIHISTYCDTDIRFIGVGWDEKTSGGGSPADSIDEAVDYFLRKTGGGTNGHRKCESRNHHRGAHDGN